MSHWSGCSLISGASTWVIPGSSTFPSRHHSPHAPPVQLLPGLLQEYPQLQLHFSLPKRSQKVEEEATLNYKYYKLLQKLPISMSVRIAHEIFKGILVPAAHAERGWVQASGEKMLELGAGSPIDGVHGKNGEVVSSQPGRH